MTDLEKAVTVRIVGRVQGVWFRGWTVDQANRRKVRGWVRNRRDGSVEALFIGPAAAVDEMVGLCRRGPPEAKVDSIDIATAADDGSRTFVQAPTD